MVAFAGNSLLCRQGLRSGAIDPALFTAVRIASGAAVLLLLMRTRNHTQRQGSWGSAAALAVYAAAFSFAYVDLGAGFGTLLLFGAVQTTMIGTGLVRGERPAKRVWVGMAAAMIGLGVLLLPSTSAGSLIGTAAMLSAGVAWGIYSLRGKGATDPVSATAGNFTRACWICVPLPLFFLGDLHADASGIGLAVASGAVTSGLGYVAWYSALRGLSATMAAIAQLSVPIIAALAGVLWLGEEPTIELLVAGALVLGGVAAAAPPSRSAQTLAKAIESR